MGDAHSLLDDIQAIYQQLFHIEEALRDFDWHCCREQIDSDESSSRELGEVALGDAIACIKNELLPAIEKIRNGFAPTVFLDQAELWKLITNDFMEFHRRLVSKEGLSIIVKEFLDKKWYFERIDKARKLHMIRMNYMSPAQPETDAQQPAESSGLPGYGSDVGDGGTVPDTTPEAAGDYFSHFSHVQDAGQASSSDDDDGDPFASGWTTSSSENDGNGGVMNVVDSESSNDDSSEDYR